MVRLRNCAGLDGAPAVWNGGPALKVVKWMGLILGAVVVWRVCWWFRSSDGNTSESGQPMDLTTTNRNFYQLLWSRAQLVAPERFNTWPVVKELTAPGVRCLEVGPGLRPRLPLDRTTYVDLSEVAVEKLRAAGADARLGVLNGLEMAERFDVVAALDVLEHVEDDGQALGELARVTASDGVLLLSVPLFRDFWTGFDDFVGHSRRYEVHELIGKLSAAGFVIERSAAYGMAPRSRWLLELGVRFMQRHPRESLREYARWINPLGMWFQRPLEWTAGLVVGERVDEVILVCRRLGISDEPPTPE